MLNQELIKFVKSFNNVTNTIILRYPCTVGASADSHVAFKFNVANIDDEAFEPIYLNSNLSEFLSIFSLFPDSYNVSFNDDVMTVKDDRTSASFILSDKDMIGMPFSLDVERFDKFSLIPTVGTFELSADVIRQLKQASAVFKSLESIVIKSNDDTVKLALISKEKFNQTRSDSFEVQLDANNEKNFELYIRTSSLFDIPLTDYTCYVKFNSTAETYMLYFTAKNFNGMAIAMSTLV